MLSHAGVRAARRSRSRPDAKPGRIYRLSDLELASRLSFFLWKSIPDDELLDVAARGKLKDPAVLAAAGSAHAGRSAGDPVDERFHGPMVARAQSADERARSDAVPRFRRHAARSDDARKRSCSSRVRCARIVTCSICLRADYTYLNERLARHYGIPKVYGSHFRRVTLTDQRGKGCWGRRAC